MMIALSRERSFYDQVVEILPYSLHLPCLVPLTSHSTSALSVLSLWKFMLSRGLMVSCYSFRVRSSSSVWAPIGASDSTALPTNHPGFPAEPALRDAVPRQGQER
jgi:hypothetical protein